MLAVVDAFEVDLGSKCKLDFASSPPSGRIDVSSRLQVDIAVTHNKSDDYLIDIPHKADDSI